LDTEKSGRKSWATLELGAAQGSQQVLLLGDAEGHLGLGILSATRKPPFTIQNSYPSSACQH